MCDNCLTNPNDTGTIYIQQLRQTLDDAICKFVKNTQYPDHDPVNGETFDFIVVGGGSAGSVLASRLSENPSWRVLLLEAGGDPPLSSEIPSTSTELFNTEYDWQYRSEPDPENCLGSVGRRCSFPRGKVLGGSSAINYLAYVRGSPEDFDEWERMGNPGWGFNSVLPYFKKSEDFKVNFDSIELMEFHGVGGVLKVEPFPSKYQTTEYISAGFKELGYNTLTDFNAQFGEGLFPWYLTMENNTRCSAAKAFLFHAQTRPNLKISKHSIVDKVLINKKGTACGVSFLKNGTVSQVKASKEVILSAGAVNSPQLLMLSGVGPQEELQELKIEVHQNLKVGYNLQDHTMFYGFPVALDIELNPSPDLNKQYFEYLTEQNLIYTDTFQGGNIGFITTSQASYRNFQLYLLRYKTSLGLEDVQNLLPSFGFSEEVQILVDSTSSVKSVLFLLPSLLRPKSRGRVTINSTNYQNHPLIHPRYFKADEDVQALLEAIDFMSSLINTKPFVELGAQVLRIDVAECRNFEFKSEEYWRCVIKYMIVPNHHLSGTCKMGPVDQEDSVVDPELRVIGVSNLRVVDASVMPAVTSGNTNVPTIAIAEKVADLIKKCWI